jgi:hypothetical protein
MHMMQKINIRRLSLFLVFTIIFLNTCSTSTVQTSQDPTLPPTNIALAEVTTEATSVDTPEPAIEATTTITPTAYLPLVNRPPVKFFGIFFKQYWTSGNVDKYMSPVDAQTGKKHTSVGWFIDLQNIAFTPIQNDNKANNFYQQLEALWSKGYISFVNLGSALEKSDYDVPINCPLPFNSIQVINGECDSAIQKMADLYSQWVSLGGGRRAMIAPLQEMNGVWTSYGAGSTSEEFILAYRYILQKFTDKGITRDQVWWVFAPNAYNDADKPEREFENYYPGDDYVDVVGFSSFNYGFCPDIPSEWRRWESYPQIFEPFIARMQTMAPSKPIIIAETGAPPWYAHDAEGNPVSDYNQMNQWLIDNYAYFATRSGVIGVFYFSFPDFNNRDCDFEINPNGQVLSGYVAGASNPSYQYLNTAQMDKLIP